MIVEDGAHDDLLAALEGPTRRLWAAFTGDAEVAA